ncbi:MAG: helix-turn-helix domain-containing protein [Clostridiales bacterium]|nr:helix-turn-helix domain-containing protein [Clostridiales bacterium]
MEETEKKTIDIFRQNITSLMNQEPSVSMRQLSQKINASESYIQKLMSGKTNPSFDKLDSIGKCFHLHGWELFYDYEEAASDCLAILQMIHRLPHSYIPLIQKYMNFLLEQYDQLTISTG